MDLTVMRRHCQARIDWDGGCALPPSIPPDAIIALLDDRNKLLDEISDLRAKLLAAQSPPKEDS